MKYALIILVLLFFYNNLLWAQETPASVRISGVVIDGDSLNPIPFTSITIKNTTRGTVSDNSGYFSIYAYELDTLLFSNVGYQSSIFVIPPNLPQESYGLVQMMKLDTLMLDEVVILSWPTAEDFASAFLSLKPRKDLNTRGFEAQRKLQKALDQQLEKEKFYYDQMRYSRLYNLTGMIPPNNFLNPLTWMNFIRNWKNGEFKTDAEGIPDMDY